MRKTLRSTINGESRVYDTDDGRMPFYVETPRGGFASNELLGALAIAEVGGNLPALQLRLVQVEDGIMRCGPYIIERQPNGAYRITDSRTGEMVEPTFSLTGVRCWIADHQQDEGAQA
jgi:hypothetical protein